VTEVARVVVAKVRPPRVGSRALNFSILFWSVDWLSDDGRDAIDLGISHHLNVPQRPAPRGGKSVRDEVGINSGACACTEARNKDDQSVWIIDVQRRGLM
jgi:hypothetical protein